RIVGGDSDGLSINIYTYGALPSQLQGCKAENTGATPDVEEPAALALRSVLEQHEQTQMRTRMGTCPKGRAGIERKARHGGRDGRGIPWGANHEAFPNTERLEELLPLREIIHVQQRSAIELYVRSLIGPGTEPLLQGSYMPAERVLKRQGPLENSPCCGLRPCLDADGTLRGQHGLLMEHHCC